MEDKLTLLKSNRSKEPTGSYFDDKPIIYALFQVLYYFLGLISATLLTPLTTYLSAKRRVSHTIINGKRLYFDGKIYQIYGHYCLWVLLSLFTLFIYTFFIPGESRKWVSKHTFFEGEYKNGSSFYSGDAYESLIVNAVTSVVKFGTLGILSPKAKVVKDEMMTKRYTYSGHHLLYIGGFEGAMGFGARNILLNLCTFGVYGLIEGCYLEDWSLRRTIIDDGRVKRHDKSKIYDVIDFFMKRKALTLVVFSLLIAIILAGIITFYVYWKGSIHGFIIFGIGMWLFIYSMFFAGNNKK